MNLLEVVAEISARTHRAKERLTAEAEPHTDCTCTNDYCRAQMPTGVMVFRGGEEVVNMTLEDHQLKYPFDIAARLYHADAVAVAIDGKNKSDGKSVDIVDAVNRAGDELWRVEPYSIAPDGRSLIWWPAEVPNEHPILEPSCAGELVRIMNKRNIGPPVGFEQLTPSMNFEQRRAVMDLGITRQIVKHANDPWHNIYAISLAATPGSARAKLLDMADDPRLWM